jgi:hypothetical protein
LKRRAGLGSLLQYAPTCLIRPKPTPCMRSPRQSLPAHAHNRYSPPCAQTASARRLAPPTTFTALPTCLCHLIHCASFTSNRSSTTSPPQYPLNRFISPLCRVAPGVDEPPMSSPSPANSRRELASSSGSIAPRQEATQTYPRDNAQPPSSTALSASHR